MTAHRSDRAGGGRTALDQLEGRVFLSAVPPRPQPIPRPAAPAVLRVNAGGLAQTDSLARRFDTGGFQGGAVARVPFEVAGTEDDSLFWAYRSGPQFTFGRTVANGNYALWLEFVEPIEGASAGRRTFDVSVEGAQVLDDFDVAADAGAARTAIARSFDVTVSDRRLDLSFVGVSGDAVVSSIVLIPTDVPTAARPYVSQHGYHPENTIQDWARNEALKVRSASHLRQIGQSIFLYTNEHKGHYPPNLVTLVLYAEGTHDQFANPRTSTKLPRGELSALERVAWVGRLEDYVYLAAGWRGSRFPPETPMAYENPDRVIGGINVLRADGSVRYFERAEAAALLGFADEPPADPPPLADPEWNRLPRDPAVFTSSGNLRQVAQRLILYSNENRGRFPPDLGTLLRTQGMQAITFWNPRTSTPPPPDGMTPEQAAEWVNRSRGYVYLAAGKSASMPGDAVLACENPVGVRDGINVLFSDGRVEFRELRWAAETIARATARGHGPVSRPPRVFSAEPIRPPARTLLSAPSPDPLLHV